VHFVGYIFVFIIENARSKKQNTSYTILRNAVAYIHKTNSTFQLYELNIMISLFSLIIQHANHMKRNICTEKWRNSTKITSRHCYVKKKMLST